MGKPLTAGLEAVLTRASRDARFREDLIARRGQAALEAGIDLNPRESAILGSVAGVQLERMIDELGKNTPAGSSYEVDAITRGIRPDLPVAPAGIRPDAPIVKGHSAKLPLLLGGAALVGGAIAVGTLTAGIGPDLPPPRAPAAGTSRQPDAMPPPASQPTSDPDAGPEIAPAAPKR